MTRPPARGQPSEVETAELVASLRASFEAARVRAASRLIRDPRQPRDWVQVAIGDDGETTLTATRGLAITAEVRVPTARLLAALEGAAEPYAAVVAMCEGEA